MSRKEKQGDADDKPKPRAVRLESSKCGKRISGEDCTALKAYEQSNQGEEPQVTATNEYPAAMSSGECQAAGKIYEKAQAGSHVVKPDECPRAMTEAQCIEAGKAYEEAMK